MIDRRLFISVTIVLLWTSYDLLRYFHQSSLIKSNDRSVPPVPKIKSHPGTTIKFLFCQGAGYRNLFKQFSDLVRDQYPQLAIQGEPYPPRWIHRQIARCLWTMKIILLICLLFGQNPFPLLRLRTPRIYAWALTNKISACLMIFFLINSLESYFLSSGAFEISINDFPLWSKLDSGRLPSSDDFVHMLKTFAASNPPDYHH